MQPRFPTLIKWWEKGKSIIKGLTIIYCCDRSSRWSQHRNLLSRFADHLKRRVDAGFVSCLGPYRSILAEISRMDIEVGRGAPYLALWLEEGKTSSVFLFVSRRSELLIGLLQPGVRMTVPLYRILMRCAVFFPPLCVLVYCWSYQSRYSQPFVGQCPLWCTDNSGRSLQWAFGSRWVFCSTKWNGQRQVAWVGWSTHGILSKVLTHFNQKNSISSWKTPSARSLLLKRQYRGPRSIFWKFMVRVNHSWS